MKSLLKLFIISAITLLFATPIIAQSNSGSLTLNINDCVFDEDGYWGNSYVISIIPNTPIKINYTLNTYDYFSIYTSDNSIYHSFVDISQPTNGTQSVTIISSTGMIYVSCEYGWNGMDNDPIFSLNYSIDQNYSISNNPSLILNDQYITGNLGIGIQPREKLDVNGSAIINNRLGIGTPAYSGYKVRLINSTDTYSLYSYTYKNTTSSVYGLYSDAYNPSGNIYGIYSSVYGPTGKKWAGYFNGGDVAVTNGNMGIGVDNPQGILQVRGTYDNSWIYFCSNAGYGPNKPKVNYGMSFTWNYSGGNGESIINYTSANGGSSPRLDFTSFDGTNLTTEMTLKNGRLGIGTTTPSTILQIVKNDASTNQTLTNSAALDIWDTNGGSNTGGQINFRSDANSGAAGIGAVIGYLNKSSNSTGSAGNLVFGVKTINTDASIIQAMTIQRGGNVGIGTMNPDTKLTVNGIIHATEVKVDLTVPADYVFKSGYKLMPLNQVEQFVKTNSHLPEIPSAAEITKNGMSMGDMQNKLLQKVEELTLYVIEQQKRIDELEKKVK